MSIKLLHNHTSPETAYVIPSYPFGRRRCQMRCWVETKAKTGEQRYCTQTTQKHLHHDEFEQTSDLSLRKNIEPFTDDRNENWNKAKKSTYDGFILMYLDENNHVQTKRLAPRYLYWADKAEKFLSWLKENNLFQQLTNEEKENICWCCRIEIDALENF